MWALGVVVDVEVETKAQAEAGREQVAAVLARALVPAAV